MPDRSESQCGATPISCLTLSDRGGEGERSPSRRYGAAERRSSGRCGSAVMDVRCAIQGGWPGVRSRSPGGLSHGSLAVVFVVPPEPVEQVVVVAGFVAPPRRTVEPLVHAPEAVEPAR